MMRSQELRFSSSLLIKRSVEDGSLPLTGGLPCVPPLLMLCSEEPCCLIGARRHQGALLSLLKHALPRRQADVTRVPLFPRLGTPAEHPADVMDALSVCR